MPTCPLCRAQSNKVAFTERGHNVIVCHECTLLYIDPYPDTSTQYDTVADYAYDDLEVADATKHQRAEVQFYTRYFDAIARHCMGASSLLDVGCGTGTLLQRASAELGLHAEGLELNSDRAELARRSGCTVHQTPIERFKSQWQYDVITLVNVLSHIPDFDALFGALRRLSKPSTRIIFKVGEVTATVQKSAIFDWGIPDHVHFLGMDTFDYICHKYDFRIVEHQRRAYSEDLFSAERWKAPGRSGLRNVVKSVAVHTPGALQLLRQLYRLRYGKDTIYSSFIVISPR